VQGHGFQAVTLEGARQAGATQLGVDEHDALRDAAVAQDLADGSALVVVIDAVEALLAD